MEETSFGLSTAVTSQHNRIADTEIRVGEPNKSNEMKAHLDQTNEYDMKIAKQRKENTVWV
jgi:hypothetical protein